MYPRKGEDRIAKTIFCQKKRRKLTPPSIIIRKEKKGKKASEVNIASKSHRKWKAMALQETCLRKGGEVASNIVL